MIRLIRREVRGHLQKIKMESSVHIPSEVINSFLREIQHGNLPDASTQMQKYDLKSPLNMKDLIVCSNRHGDTPLLVAARHGHTNLVRIIYEDFGVFLDHCNLDGKRALHEAAQNGQMECVQLLIEAGSAVDCLKKADWTPLMLACTKDSLGTVQTLVNYKASLKLRNKDGWNSFHIACREGHSDIVSFLLDTAPDPSHWDTVSKNGRTPLHTAALHGRLEALRILKDRCNYDPNKKDSCGATPLMDAARGNHASTTAFLLESYGAQINLEDSLGRQAVHLAAQTGATESLQCLVQHGADVNRRAGVNGLTPLHYAAKEGQAEAVSLLLQSGADLCAIDKKGRTGLDLARNAREAAETVAVLESTHLIN